MQISPITNLPARRKSVAAVTFLALLPALLIFASCAVRFIGDYDDSVDKGVTEVQQKSELYLSKLQSTPNTPYDQSFYDDMNARLAVLKSRAASLPKYPIVLEQLTDLKSQFDTFQKLDVAAARPFPAAAAKDAEAAIAVSVESILKLELALKDRGKASAPALTARK